jgi:hypothetical protein
MINIFFDFDFLGLGLMDEYYNLSLNAHSGAFSGFMHACPICVGFWGKRGWGDRRA